MKLMLSILTVTLFGFMQTSEITERSLFFDSVGQEQIKTNYEFHENRSPTDPVSIAYKGASLAMMAEVLTWPWEKLSYFNDGTELIEKAVELDNSNPEIRFIRLSLQHNCPSFLGYSTNIEEDLNFITERNYSHIANVDREFWIRAQKYMLDAELIQDPFIEQMTIENEEY